jgi:C-terminal processing protease CtpA/Prc
MRCSTGASRQAEGGEQDHEVAVVQPEIAETTAEIGVEERDLIIDIGDVNIDSAAAIAASMQRVRAGDPVTITVERAERRIERNGTVTEAPQAPAPGMERSRSEPSGG